jgi:hypothetical protein
MGLSSITHKRTGEFRLFVLARALDPDGSGHIEAAKLKAAALSYGVKPRTYAAWLAGAFVCGLFERIGETLRIRSQAKAYEVFGCASLDKRKSTLTLKQLFSKSWRARVLAAYVKANHNGEIISLEKLEALTGIPARTLKKDGMGKFVHRTRQFAILNAPADHVPGLNEHSSRGKHFKFIDPANGNEARAAKHVPSRKSVSDNVARIGAKGRRRAILATVAHGEELACNRRSLFSQAENVILMRLFYSTPKTQKAKAKHEKTVIRLTQTTRLPHDPAEVFVQRGRRDAWDCLELPDSKQFFMSA